MKKKLNLAELVLAVIFVAATASAANPSYTPLQPKSYECLIFELDLIQLHAVEVIDEKGSKYIHTDLVPRKMTQVFYYRQTTGRRFWQCWQAKVNTNGKSLNGSGENRQNVMIMNPYEGGNEGFIAFVINIPSLDKFLPSLNCHLSGSIEGEWLEDEQRWVVISGRGVVSAHSTSTKYTANEFMQPAVPSIQSPIAPAWGSFTVRRAILTEKEIVQLIK